MIFGATNLANLLNLILSLTLARVLGPEAFGLISAFFAVQLFGMLLISGWQNTLVVHLKSLSATERDQFAGWAMSRVPPLAIGLLVSVAVLIAQRGNGPIETVKLPLLGVALLFSLGLNYWLVHLRAADLFASRNKRFAANLVLESGAKVALILGGTLLTRDPITLAAICAASQVIPFVSYFCRSDGVLARTARPAFKVGRLFILLQGGFFAFFDSDLVIAASLASGEGAGQLAVLNLAAKIVFFAFTGLTIAIIADQARLEPEAARRKLFESTRMLGIGTIILVAGGALLPGLAFTILTGDPAYASAIELTLILSTAALFTLNAFAMNALCARERYDWIGPYLWIAALRSAAVITLFWINVPLVVVLGLNLATQALLSLLIFRGTRSGFKRHANA